MSFNSSQQKSIHLAGASFLEARRPPLEIRDQLDLLYIIEKQSVYVAEVRPDWQDSTIKREFPCAKCTYVKTKDVWKVYWLRGDLKWYSYEPKPIVKSISAFFQLVGEDAHACFFG